MRFIPFLFLALFAGRATSSPSMDSTVSGRPWANKEQAGPTRVIPFEPDRTYSGATFLLQNWPNPASTNATIWFFVREIGAVSLKIYDAAWREIGYFAIPANRQSKGAWYRVVFPVGMLQSGEYFYRLQTSGSSEIRVMTILR
jgi:hypothetical protein